MSKKHTEQAATSTEASAKESTASHVTGHLRGYFFAGILVTAPVGITLYLTWLLVRWVDGLVTPLLPAAFNPETYLPFALPGLGLLIVFVGLSFVGWATAGLLGRLWTRISENTLSRMPFMRGIYAALKQVAETVLAQKSSAFRQVVLVEYPRRDIWVIGFITGETLGEVQAVTNSQVVNVFLPTTPNPTSGFLLFVPREDVTILQMSVEDGLKMVVSGGILTPPTPTQSGAG